MNQIEKNRFARAIDRTIEIFAPGLAARREGARRRLHAFRYAGATPSRDRVTTSYSLQGSESPTYARDRIQIMKEARDLAENGEVANAILGKFETHVAGRINYEPKTGSKRADNAIREWWPEWCKRADYTQRHSLQKLVQIGLRSTLTDGDCGLVPFIDEDGEAKVIGIEGDRIGSPHDTTPRRGYVHGIHLDSRNAPQSFEIYQRDEFGQYHSPELIPAVNFCHLANQGQFDRYRGVSAFAPVINVAVDIQEIVQFEKLAVKWGSMQTGVVTGAPGGPQSNEWYEDGDTTTGLAKRVQEVLYGQINYLENGENIMQFKTERPGAAWEGFLQLLIRLYAGGVNLPFGFVFDISQARGPGARFEAEQARRTFELWQDLLVEKALDKIKNIAITAAIARGDLPSHRRIFKGIWRFPRHASIDLGRESAADVAEVEAAIKSQGTVLAKYSLDGHTERRAIGEEIRDWMDISEELDVPLQYLIGDRVKSAQAPPEVGGEDDAEDGKDAKKGKGFSEIHLHDGRNGHASLQPINVRTAPIHLNLGKEAEPKKKVRKRIELKHRGSKVVGADIIEETEGGESKRSVKLEKGSRVRIDGNDLLEVQR